MLPIYICEDMEGELKYIKNTIEKLIKSEKYSEMQLVCAAKEPQEILEHIKCYRQQSLYFLDIDLKQDMNGLELAKEIRKIDPRGFIVIVTTHDEMAQATFKYLIEAMDFIEKGNTDMEDRIRKCLENIYKVYYSQTNEVSKTIEIKAGGNRTLIRGRDIYYIESVKDQSHRIKIFHKNGTTSLNASLADIEKDENESLFRCHKTCIINLYHVRRIDHNKKVVEFDDGRTYIVSRYRIKKLEECWRGLAIE